jgi:ribose-phosphate pyrophosphokinase
MDKQRDYTQPGVVSKSVLVAGDIDIIGRTAIVIDDIADSMGTMIAAVKDLVTHGIKDVIVVVMHGILSGAAIERINSCNEILHVIVTNTIDQTQNLEKCPKLMVVDTSPLFGEVIRRISDGGSLSALFE